MKITKRQKREALRKIARQLYRQGFTTREVGSKLGKSHTWVASAVRTLKVDKNT